MFSGVKTSLKKEWNKMLSDKMILIAVIVIPVLVNILLGFVLAKNQIQNISMGVVDEDNSSLSRMIVQQFRENEIFNIKYDLNDSKALEKLIDSSKIRVGMVIPFGFEKDLKNLKSPTLMMLYDGSHMSIASSAKSRATEILMTLKTGVLIKLLEANLNLSPNDAQRMAIGVNLGNRTLYNPTKNFKFFLLPGFGIAIIQTGIALMCAVAVRSFELEDGITKRMGYIVGKVLFYALIGTLAITICVLLQCLVFNVPLRGNFAEILILGFAFITSVSAFCIMISAWVRNEMLATIINSVIFIPSTIMVGYTWPVLSMPKVYQIFAAIQPFYHFADNLRDLLLKGWTGTQVSIELIWFAKFIAVVLAVAIIGVLRLKGGEIKNEEKLLEESPELFVNESVI